MNQNRVPPIYHHYTVVYHFAAGQCRLPVKKESRVASFGDNKGSPQSGGMVERYACDMCPRSYKRKDHLRRHQKDAHGGVPQVPVCTVLQCNYCEQTFTRKEHRSRHERNFHGEDLGPFTCVLCYKVFKNARNLHSHMTYKHLRAAELEIKFKNEPDYSPFLP